MLVEQFVMAYGVEQDRIRAILPAGFTSLRPVLRINAEIRNNKETYIEFNTAVEHEGIKGWINIGYWNSAEFYKSESVTVFTTDNLKISFRKTGIQGGCPAEKDNSGCWFVDEGFRNSEDISSFKEFCDCEFSWNFDGQGTGGKSIGKTLPAVLTEIRQIYPAQEFTVHNAAIIPCEQVLGSYTITFER